MSDAHLVSRRLVGHQAICDSCGRIEGEDGVRNGRMADDDRRKANEALAEFRRRGWLIVTRCPFCRPS